MLQMLQIKCIMSFYKLAQAQGREYNRDMDQSTVKE